RSAFCTRAGRVQAYPCVPCPIGCTRYFFVAAVVVPETSCPPVLHPCHPCTIASVAAKPDTHSHSGNQGSRPYPQRGPAIRFRSSAHALVNRTGNDSVA